MSNTCMIVPRVLSYMVWQFSDIGQGRKYEDKGHPIASVYEQRNHFLMSETVLVPFIPKTRMRLIFNDLIKLVF